MEISLDHARVMTEVNRLRALARELNSMQAAAQNALRDMNQFWEGSAANAFDEKNAQWRREIKSIEDEINNLAELIRKIADEIRDAEARAKKAINNFG
jgi:WXG100 family type VII secretion target